MRRWWPPHVVHSVAPAAESHSMSFFDIAYLQIEPTTRCNYTCGFCAGRHMQQLDLDFAIFKSVIDQIKNPLHVELQGEGEPLLHPDFFAMVAYLRECFPIVKISTITNGSLFTNENITRLLSVPVDSLMVSLESADEITFQNIRGGKLDRVKRGLLKLQEQKKLGGFAKPTVGLAITLMHSTFEQLPAIADLYDALDLDGGILLQPLQGMEHYRNFYDAATAQNLLTQNDRLAINEIIATSADLRRQLATYQNQSHFYSELYNSIKYPGCPWLQNGLYLAADGSVASCCFIKNTQHHGLGTPKNPDISEQILAKAIEHRRHILQQLRNGAIPPQCSGCGIAKKMRQANIESEKHHQIAE